MSRRSSDLGLVRIFFACTGLVLLGAILCDATSWSATGRTLIILGAFGMFGVGKALTDGR